MLKTLLLKLRSIIVKDDGNKKVLIKESTINNLKLIKIEDLSDEENKLILEAHRRILRTSKEQNDSNEVAVVVNITNKLILDPIIGKEDETVFSDDLIDNEFCEYALCHNHPKGGDFSFEDINTFLGYSNIKLMTIVTNNGRIMYLYKGKKYTVKPLSKVIGKLKFKTFKSISDKKYIVDIFDKNIYYMGIKRRR